MASIWVNKWWNHFTKEQPYFNHIILFFISFSFILSDWMYGPFTFTELLLGVIIVVLFIFGKFRIHTHQIKWLVLPILLISVHSAYHSVLNVDFVLQTAIIAVINFSYYLFVIIGIYNYIRAQKLEKSFLLWNNIMAMIVCLLAAYIAFSVYANINLNFELPYEFLLQFTRVDGHLYRSDIPIVRLKSIFEEPAHLGYYLNSVLIMNLLNKVNVKPNWIMTSIIVMTVILTLSYSSVFILGVILLFWVINTATKNPQLLKWNYKKAIFLIIGFFFILIFRDFLYTTLIQRTSDLIQGTESSGYERLIISWRFINRETLFSGIGFMQTPGVLWNIFAYILTELGIVFFLIYILFILYIGTVNIPIGIVFILMNFAKGGYLSSSFWFLILIVLLYSTFNYKRFFSLPRKEVNGEN